MFRPRTLAGVSLILVIVQSAFCIWQPSNLKNEIMCDSVDCVRRGKLYKDNMYDHAHPCQDFYSFTCGNWFKSQPGPKYSAEWTVLDIMVSDFAKIIRDTLESYKHDKQIPVILKKATEIYDNCVKIPEYPKATEASNIAKEIVKIGRLPKTPFWDIHTKYLELTGESAFFRTRLLSISSESVLIAIESTSAYGSIMHDEPWKPQEKKAYMDFVFEIIKSLNLSDSDAEIKKRIKKVFEFRIKFNEMILQNLDRDPETLIPVTAQELNKLFSDTLQNETNTQEIPWVEVMRALYHKLPLRERHPRKLITLRQTQYFLDLIELLNNVPADVLAFHMEIYFIERNLKLNDNMYKLLERTSIEPHKTLRYIRERFYPRWETCIENYNKKEVLETMLYIRWSLNQKQEERMIRQLITDTKLEIYNLMSKAEWVDLPTRAKTLAKLNDMNPWIGFPPWVTGDEFPRWRDEADILKPNAELNVEGEYLYIYLPILISPVFNVKLPAIYNYAGLGTTIGHELYHVVNACGTYSTTTGSITWWSKEIQQKCFQKLLSFVIAYNKVTDREFKNHYNIVIKSNTSRTVLENYPDVMGLEAAYNVYKNSASKDNSVCRTLPYFASYSCDQMFYIAFANTYCGYHTKKAALRKLETAEHSIERIRINGAVAQMESFGKAFNCPVGSPMNPEEKVNLWK